MHLTKTIAISITEGRVVRDLFCNGFLDMMNDAGYKVLIISPAASVSRFVDRWTKPGVSFAKLAHHDLKSSEYIILKLRNRVMRLGTKVLHRWMVLEHNFWKSDIGLKNLLREHKCCLAVITHPMHHSEMPVYLAAKSLDLPTLGILRSWDNLFKGLRIRPDMLAVWNSVNRQEAVDFMKYPSDQVVVLGAAQFDAYFDSQSAWSREKFAASMNLDPARPIITVATLGAFLNLYDETYLVDFLLDVIRDRRIAGNPQLVIRLHPASKVESFSIYHGLPDVHISHMTGYIPTLGWTMTRKDVIFMANLLRHSDVVISPGSTITIETAIFDTPTIVPVFHTYQPELGKIQFDNHLSKHFKRLKDLDLVPFVNTPDALVSAICKALEYPSWYRTQRKQLVDDYIHFTDGKSVKRLVNLIVETVSGEKQKLDNNSDLFHNYALLPD